MKDGNRWLVGLTICPGIIAPILIYLLLTVLNKLTANTVTYANKVVKLNPMNAPCNLQMYGCNPGF